MTSPDLVLASWDDRVESATGCPKALADLASACADVGIDANTLFLFALKGSPSDRETDEAKIPQSNGKQHIIVDRHYVAGEPATLALNRMHRYAFDDLRTKAFVYLDPTALTDYFDDLRAGMVDLIQAAADRSNDFVIGDYEPVVSESNTTQDDVAGKIGIEKLVKEMMSQRFGSVLRQWNEFEHLGRVRSEFYGIRKRLYDDLTRVKPIPYDYGLQVLLVACRNRRQIRRVEIGDVPEKNKFTQTKWLAQLRRVSFQLELLDT